MDDGTAGVGSRTVSGLGALRATYVGLVWRLEVAVNQHNVTLGQVLSIRVFFFFSES